MSRSENQIVEEDRTIEQETRIRNVNVKYYSGCQWSKYWEELENQGQTDKSVHVLYWIHQNRSQLSKQQPDHANYTGFLWRLGLQCQIVHESTYQWDSQIHGPIVDREPGTAIDQQNERPSCLLDQDCSNKDIM